MAGDSVSVGIDKLRRSMNVRAVQRAAVLGVVLPVGDTLDTLLPTSMNGYRFWVRVKNLRILPDYIPFATNETHLLTIPIRLLHGMKWNLCSKPSKKS